MHNVDILRFYEAIRAGDLQEVRFGNTTLTTAVAELELYQGPSFPAGDCRKFAVLAMMKVQRVSALAKLNPFEKPFAGGSLTTPSLYVYSDDQSSVFSIDAVGGSTTIRRLMAELPADTLIPVALMIEHNQKLISPEEIPEATFDKLNRGLYARNGRPQDYMAGSHIESLITPNRVFGRALDMDQAPEPENTSDAGIRSSNTVFYEARVNTTNCECYGYGSTPEEAIATLLDTWVNKWCKMTKADPNLLNEAEYRESTVVSKVALGKGYVSGLVDNLARPIAIRGDDPSLDGVYNLHLGAPAPRR